MALTEKEEFELLSLEREKSMISKDTSSQKTSPDSVATKGLGYMADHPFKTAFQSPAQTLTGESAQNQLLRKQPYTTFPGRNNPLINAAEIGFNTFKDMPASAVGFGIDQMTPFNIATAGVSRIPGVQQAAEAIGQTAPAQAFGRFLTNQRGLPNPGQYVKDLISGPERAIQAGSQAKFNIGQQTADQIANAQRLGKAKINIAQENGNTISKGFDDLTDVMKKQVSKYSDKQGQELQKELPKLFGKKSEEYGAKKTALVEGKDITIPANKALKSVEDSLLEHGILRKENGKLITARAPMTPAEQEVFSLYTGTKNQLLDNPGATISAEDLMRTQKYIQPEYGKPWTPDDKLKSLVSQKLDSQLKDAIPGFKELQKEYAPFLQWKQAVIDKVKPFNGKYDVATDALSKAGSKDMTPSEQRLMAKLTDNYQSEAGNRVGALNKGIQQTAVNKEQAQQAAKDTISGLRTDLAKEIRTLRQKKIINTHDVEMTTQNLLKKYKVQRLKAGAISGGITGGVGIWKAVEHYIKGEIYSNTHN